MKFKGFYYRNVQAFFQTLLWRILQTFYKETIIINTSKVIYIIFILFYYMKLVIKIVI